jgi:hypothetical protein
LALVGEGRIAGDDEQPADAAEGGNDLLDHAVGEILLLRIAAHIGKRQYRDRRLVGERQSRRVTLTRLPPLALGTLSRIAGEGGPRRVSVGVGEGRTNPIDAYWPGNVFDLPLAQILNDKGQPVADVVVDRIGDEHPAGIGEGFDPRGDVDAVAIEVVTLDDDVAEIYADAQLDAIVRLDAGVPRGHPLLHFDRAAHRIDDAGKFHQQAVTGGFDDAAVMLGDFRIEELAAQRFEAFVRAFLVRPHQPRIPRHIGGEDSGKAAGGRHRPAQLKGLKPGTPSRSKSRKFRVTTVRLWTTAVAAIMASAIRSAGFPCISRAQQRKVPPSIGKIL